MSSCPNCGAELDDFGPFCPCTFDPKPKANPRRDTMRTMVARKLARKKTEQKKEKVP